MYRVKGQDKVNRGQNALFTNITASTFTNKDSEPFNIVIDTSYGVFTDKGQRSILSFFLHFYLVLRNHMTHYNQLW